MIYISKTQFTVSYSPMYDRHNMIITNQHCVTLHLCYYLLTFLQELGRSGDGLIATVRRVCVSLQHVLLDLLIVNKSKNEAIFV